MLKTVNLKKALGQNFLINPRIIDKIVRSSNITNNDIILEIGTGDGMLTKGLAKKAKHIISFEIDKNIFEIAKENLKNYSNVLLINEDFLKADLKNLLSKFDGRLKVVANVPYYITTPIIKKIIEHKNFFSEIYLTVQKEFAKRICAKPATKDYSAFTIFINYFAQGKILFDITKNNFMPKPKVDSSFIHLIIRRYPIISVKNENLFFDIVKAAFNQRRKTLKNSLSSKFDKPLVEKALSKSNIDPKRRGETLSIEEFAKIEEYFN